VQRNNQQTDVTSGREQKKKKKKILLSMEGTEFNMSVKNLHEMRGPRITAE
jgi:hypothetical protein